MRNNMRIHSISVKKLLKEAQGSRVALLGTAGSHKPKLEPAPPHHPTSPPPAVAVGPFSCLEAASRWRPGDHQLSRRGRAP